MSGSRGCEPLIHRVWHMFLLQKLRRHTAMALLEYGSLDALIARAGEITLRFGDGSELRCAPRGRGATWEVRGGGALEGAGPEALSDDGCVLE